jgi:hypothetical protein
MKANVDAIVVRDNRVFAYGWAFEPAAVLKTLRLDVVLTDGAKVSLPLNYGKARPDVALVFPDDNQALYSGWMAYAAWEGAAAHSFSLNGTFEDGTDVSFHLPAAAVGVAAVVPAVPAPFSRRATSRVFKFLGVQPVETPAIVENIAFTAPDGISAALVIDSLRSALIAAGQAKCTVAIDHDMGGGANHYRKHWMHGRATKRPVALLLGFEISSQRYFLEMTVSDISERFFMADDAIVDMLIRSDLVDEVFYNDAVSFPRPGDVPGWLLSFKRVAKVRLTMAVHDYFSICPSQFLLNDSGRFCHIPEIAECLRCLPRNENEFSTLFTARSITDWRSKWSSALIVADSIVCFSQSSKTLLMRAYPELGDAYLKIEPHEIEPFEWTPQVDMSAPLHLGVVGAIGIHKGARVLQALAEEIAKTGCNVRITVIGSVELPCDVTVLQSTGPFERGELPALIEKSGINLFLLPSICPETFSYVTQELMSLRMPLACFDLGAPAERVARYSRGRVLTCPDAGSLLEDLQRFHQDLAAVTEGKPS